MTTSNYLTVCLPVCFALLSWGIWVTLAIFGIRREIAAVKAEAKSSDSAHRAVLDSMNVRIDRSTDRLDKINGHLANMAGMTGRIERNILRLANKAGVEGEQERPSHDDR